MGTRSTTAIKNGNKESKTLCKFYRQFDGYINGHGFELKEYFGNTKIINGYGDETSPEYANGMGCLAAQMITHFKNQNSIGGIYMTDIDDSQDYDYVIYEGEESFELRNNYRKTINSIMVEVSSFGKVLYDGLLSELEDKEVEDEN